MTWKDVIVKLIDMVTEDKLVAMFSLTIIALVAMNKYPIVNSLPIITAIVGSIAGFVTGVAVGKKSG